MLVPSLVITATDQPATGSYASRPLKIAASERSPSFICLRSWTGELGIESRKENGRQVKDAAKLFQLSSLRKHLYLPSSECHTNGGTRVGRSFLSFLQVWATSLSRSHSTVVGHCYIWCILRRQILKKWRFEFGQ